VRLQDKVARVGAEAVALVAEVGGFETAVERSRDGLGVLEVDKGHEPVDGDWLALQGQGRGVGGGGGRVVAAGVGLAVVLAAQLDAELRGGGG
jgi:hypothetical protein